MTLSIHSPDELIAAIPHLLGFKAEESIVFVPLRADLPLARVDLPTTASQRNEAWGAIRGAFSRYAQPGASVAIVCMTHDQQAADLIGHDYAVRLASIGIDTPLKLSADATDWYDLDSGESGVQSEGARNRLAATTVLAGRAHPVSDRDALATSLVGDREPVAQFLLRTRDESAQRSPGQDEQWALGRLQQFQADGVRLSDSDAARLLVTVESIPVRDELWNDMRRDNANSHVALWTDLTRRAPDEVRAGPASLLGFAAWQSGNGAMAWCALDQVPKDKRYVLADLVAAAIQTGMHPREWEAVKAAPPQREVERGSDFILGHARAQTGPTRPAPGI
ncbi:DUF4192 domain-containing protein [Nocardioides jensenii]|uniref:DUF4192 domain-containing protein n=1 Tax=Nocardioides jensenii TaxID=1843 RepID=UPI000832961B|nr:DUF4192 domain-containing protein [Nocardioides jensenii]